MDKCKQTRYLIDKVILGKMREVYVTYVANVDKGWHVVTLVWSYSMSLFTYYDQNINISFLKNRSPWTLVYCNLSTLSHLQAMSFVVTSLHINLLPVKFCDFSLSWLFWRTDDIIVMVAWGPSADHSRHLSICLQETSTLVGLSVTTSVLFILWEQKIRVKFSV